MNYVIGLTGGIGCGKSTVASLFQALGIPIIDSDLISHRLTQPDGKAIPPIRDAFGTDTINADGALDRAAMRQKIFADPAARQRLEAILHPLIRFEMLAQAQATSPAPYLIMVVPLLFEAKSYRELVQRALVVDCPEATQIARTMQRSSLTEQEVRAIMAQQLPRSERLALADDVIENNGNMDELRAKTLQLHQFYLNRSSGAAPVRQGSA